jgi:hypothetical protein
MFLTRTKFGKKTRRKKPEQDLKTLYYYREGILKIETTDNSGLGLYAGVYVFIKKYSKERDQFLIEDNDGQETWTDFIVPIRPTINGYDLYHTCFEFLVAQNHKDGDTVCYRIKNGFAFLKKESKTDSSYVLYKDGGLNLENIPRSFNFCLGYCENEIVAVKPAFFCPTSYFHICNSNIYNGQDS